MNNIWLEAWEQLDKLNRVSLQEWRKISGASAAKPVEEKSPADILTAWLDNATRTGGAYILDSWVEEDENTLNITGTVTSDDGDKGAIRYIRTFLERQLTNDVAFCAEIRVLAEEDTEDIAPGWKQYQFYATWDKEELADERILAAVPEEFK